MERGRIPTADLDGGINLQATLESGQSYCWRRDDGETYARSGATGGDAWYHTVVDTGSLPATSSAAGSGLEVVRVRQRDGALEWESTTDADPLLRHLLRLDDDLPAIRTRIPDDPPIERAWNAFEGLRIVRDPPFRALVSFICSAQMRVARIHGMQVRLAETLGDRVEADGRTYHAFPGPEQLAETGEEQLRDLGLGYRAPYVRETAAMVAGGETPVAVRGEPYEAARESLTRFVGVGDKVADCVLLFSLGYLEAVPLDTWIRSAITEHFPDCDRGSYAETSRAIRDRLGGDCAGYAQTRVFAHLRTRDG
jgi:N-glycosylase/DNA lyase